MRPATLLRYVNRRRILRTGTARDHLAVSTLADIEIDAYDAAVDKLYEEMQLIPQR